MFNAAGEVIGIVSHNISKSGGSEGLGFVVTMKTAKQLLLEKKSFWGGIDGQILSDEMLDLLNVPNNMRGFLVKSVAKGSPGDEAGLVGGTKVVTVDGGQRSLAAISSLDEGISAESGASMIKIRDTGHAQPGAPHRDLPFVRPRDRPERTRHTPAHLRLPSSCSWRTPRDPVGVTHVESRPCTAR